MALIVSGRTTATMAAVMRKGPWGFGGGGSGMNFEVRFALCPVVRSWWLYHRREAGFDSTESPHYGRGRRADRPKGWSDRSGGEGGGGVA